MKEIQPKTIEEHREYLYSIVRLKLHWLHRFLKAHPEESFRHAIRERVDIYRKTDANREALNPEHFYFDVSPWLDMETAAEGCYFRFKDDAALFEEYAFEIFKPSISARLIRDFQDRTGTLGYQCGSLRYETQTSIIDGKKCLGFHIANAIAPHSIFEEKEYLMKCFDMLLWSAENIFGAECISTHSWLNQFPLWLRYFPDEWLQNMGEPNKDIRWHYGFWGQFITARGTFNAKYGKIVRETGKLPYYPCGSHCSIEAMKKHLSLCSF